jgi:hypothetical protein
MVMTLLVPYNILTGQETVGFSWRTLLSVVTVLLKVRVDFTSIQHLSPDWHCCCLCLCSRHMSTHSCVGFICSSVCPQSIFGKFWPIVMRYKMPFTKLYASENCALLGYYAVNNGNLLPTFQDNLSVLPFLTSDDGTGRLSQNVGQKLPLLAA